MRIRKKPWAVPELLECGFYVENPQEFKGRWKERFPAAQNPLHIELGCGKGSFISQLAFLNPDINYIGVDIKSDMLGVAKRTTEKVFGGEKPKNLLLVAYDVERLFNVFDQRDTTDRIYINFCNPWPKAKHTKHRLTHTKQLNIYREFLKDGGEIRFKTDDDGLFLSSKRYFSEAGFEITYITEDLHRENLPDNIMTEHEKMFSDMGIKIKYIIAKKLPKQTDA